MAFGADLKDFVASFQAGYGMVKSKEEKEWEREERRMKKESHEWGREGDLADRDYRERGFSRQLERDKVGDAQFERQFDFGQRKFDEDTRQFNERVKRSDRAFDYGVRQDGMTQERWATDRADRLAKEKMGPGGDDAIVPQEVDKFMEREGVIPADRDAPARPEGTYEESALPTDGLVQNASYSAGRNTGFNLDNYLSSIRTAESGGNDRARNPLSSATGRYQFLGGTWNELARKHPELGLTRNGRYDPEQQEVAIRRFTYNNGRVLKNAGVPLTNGTLYAAHFLGAGGAAKVLRANPDAPISRLVSPEVMRANPFLRGMSVGDFEQWAERKGSGSRRRRNRTVSAASGGMIEAIPVDDEEDDPDLVIPEQTVALPAVEVEGDPGTALPDEMDAPMPRPKYEGAAEGQQEEPTDDPFEQGRRAVRDGLKTAMKQAQIDRDTPLDDPDMERRRQNYLRGYGAAHPQLVRQVIDTIDPERKLPTGVRNMRAIGTVYQFYVDRGEYDKAQTAASSMVQAYRQSTQQLMSMAQAAVEKGDMDNAAKAAIAAYANIPNGREFNVEKKGEDAYEIVVTGADGDEVTRQTLSARDIAEQAMKFNPGTFDEEIINAQGQTGPKRDAISTTQLGEVATGVDAAMEDFTAAPENARLNPKVTTAIRDIAVDIAGDTENGIDPVQATRIAAGLMDFNKDDPNDDSAPYAARKIPGSNLFQVTDKRTGVTFRVSKSQFNNLTGARGAAVEAREAGREEQRKSDERSAGRKETLRKFRDLFRGGDDDGTAIPEEELPADRRQLPMGAVDVPDLLPRDEPPDPSWVPEPEAWRTGRSPR